MSKKRLRFLRFEVQENTETESNFGRTQSWVTKWYVMASMQAIKFQEKLKADALQVTATHRITCHYFSILDEKKRLKYGNRIFNIESVDNVDSRYRKMQLIVSEQK